ncbi:uncharacterized protein LOC119765909 [Culex quinquefasciatus]|uniref:uncharacterized protein LOC119765909 n=1 Tax=Culex quinquefasciatus TaxID=7176 RepID=UPI0018E34065|nr:uncharacterized protein LOC119765909 [Culex quinquefasciatus]
MERVFQCPLCEECFESKICLENHLGDVHKRSNLAELIAATYAGESEPGSVITSQPVATNLPNCDSQIEISQKVTSENDQDDFDCCGCCFGDGGEGNAEDCQSTGQQDGGGWLSSGEADGGGGSCD